MLNSKLLYVIVVLAGAVFVCLVLDHGDPITSPSVSPPDGTSPLGMVGPALNNINLSAADEKKIVNGRLNRFEGVSNEFAEELAQKAYGIEAETSGRELLEDSAHQSAESENVLLSLSDKGVNRVEFARAARHAGLEMLDISGASGITAAGLMELRNLDRLKTLRMERVRVGPAELEAVANLPIQRLYLSDSQLSDADCKILAKSRSLVRLDVSHNPVSAKGIEELSAIKTLKLLRFVKTEAGVRARVALRAAGWQGENEWYSRSRSR